VTVGVPIPALVPLPGKAMAPMPAKVTIVANPNTVCVGPDPTFGLQPKNPDGTCPAPAVLRPTGSLAKVDHSDTYPAGPGILAGRIRNPGYPFWIAGIEDVVGQRPPSPPLDMVTHGDATDANSVAHAKTVDAALFANLDPAQADGWNGGLPRGALEGYAAGGISHSTESAIDFSKTVEVSRGVFYPEYGTDLERSVMAYHAVRNHPTFLSDGTGATAADFVANGLLPVVGAPYHEPCLDDNGVELRDGVEGHFFGPGLTQMLDPEGMTVTGNSVFNAQHPRIYKGTNIQYDAVFNKAGYHYPQQRIISLWEDAVPIITKQKAGQPLVMRINTFDCAIYHHSNLVPEVYEIDDYQVRTPTDIIGQHIHLPKWDLTTADGSANGWNYEDGTLSPGAVRERIHALNEFLLTPGSAHRVGVGSPEEFVTPGELTAAAHPYFGSVAPVEFKPLWIGARTTTQRWFADPVVNTEGVDRGLGIIFTHDHYGPSTHQQIGLYATVLTEPAGSYWAHNETGQQIGDRSTYGDGGRIDGGPTGWQVAILPQPNTPAGASTLEPFREFYFEYSDFQHAYEAGVYVGTGQWGEPLPGAGQDLPPAVMNAGNPDFDGTAANAFRFAINPPARDQVAPVFPDLVLEIANTPAVIPDPANPGAFIPNPNNFCPTRPCPQAIDVQDPGMHVVNYRNEPVGLRIFDPLKNGPDLKPGMQADGPAGDLAFALSHKDFKGNPIVRKFEVSKFNTNFGTPPPTGPGGGFQVLNIQPEGGDFINGTIFPPLVNTPTALGPGDPFTPMLRTYAGDKIRVKMQAGGHEEEHNATIHGMKWLQAGSAHGKAGNSGWRNAQAGGISEQFTLSVPVVANQGAKKATMPGGTVTGSDYAYSMDASNDGWFSGTWGIVRSYDAYRADLFDLPSNPKPKPPKITNKASFTGVCPANLDGTTKSLRSYQVVAMMANELLDKPAAVTFPAPGSLVATQHVGGPLNANGGTLVYNPRTASVTGIGVDPVTGVAGPVSHNGPIHDPTALLYVRLDDLEAVTPNARACEDSINRKTGEVKFPGLAKPDCPVTLKAGVRVEPLVLRAAAGDCIEVTLYNRVPELPPDLATYSTTQGVVKRDRLNPLGATTFQTNLFRPSGYVGIHPQLVEYDVSLHDGMNVGYNSVQTVDPTVGGKTGATSQQTYRWYAGDLRNIPRFDLGPSTWEIKETPVEFGGSNLQPADVVKQGAKSLVGQLVIEPHGATWNEDTDDANGRQTATVTVGETTFRDFSTVWTKGLTHYYADSSSVEHMNGEGVGIPEDSQEASGMAINYGIEPLWFRAGILPQSDFGNTGYGGIPQSNLFSNAKVGGDPATPVFTVAAGTPFRMRVTNPYGTSRGTTFQLHGYVWQRDPYICVDDTGAPKTKDGILGRCGASQTLGAADYEVGSTGIGVNLQAFYQGGQESITPAAHFDIVPTQTGNPGDYLFRDSASFGNASGLWGIVRVNP